MTTVIKRKNKKRQNGTEREKNFKVRYQQEFPRLQDAGSF